MERYYDTTDNMAASEEVREYAQSFYCALTLKVMSDPVIDPEGITYERSAIEEWLKRSETSPITRSPLRIADLIPNRALREAIESARGTQATPSGLSSATALGEGPSPSAGTSVASGVELTAAGLDGSLLVSVVPPAEGRRTAVDICCVIDVSGSMSRNATLQNEAGGVEEFDIDLLDVVKHSVKTVINMLGTEDRLSIVAFSSTATTHLTLTSMSEPGRRRAISSLEALEPNGATNLWAGLQMGLESLRTAKAPARSSNRLRTVLVLTDGLPNVEPPRGHLPTLEKYLQRYPDFSCSVNTFGFGYCLDSELLSQIAVLGGGNYAFIPDSGFVGTIFVNFLANTLASLASQTRVSVEFLNGVVPAAVPGSYPSKQVDSGRLVVNIGALQYFQQRNCLINYQLPEGFDPSLQIANVTVDYRPVTSASPVTLATTASLIVSPTAAQRKALTCQRARLALVDAIRTAVAFNALTRANDECIVDTSRLGESRAAIATFLEQWPATSADIVLGGTDDDNDKDAAALYAGLLKDMSGQVTQAVSRAEWYSRWGQHYLPSLMNAHLAQQCNNFKDAGVQAYGKGRLFALLQDEADDIFGKLPPPSRKIESMRVFNNVGGGCFAGSCLVRLANGSVKLVSEVRKGDRLATGATRADAATVVCVVKTTYPQSHSMLCAVGDLVVTPWHPISLDGGISWTFPAHVVQPTSLPCSSVYTFVLDSAHSVVINNVQCVTLGHSFTEDIRAHPYFGSSLVVDDLSRIAGWSEGLVQLTPDCFRKSFIGSEQVISQIVAPSLSY